MQLGSFYDHSLRVLKFLQVPVEVGGKYKNAILSVGQDHTLSLISLEDFSRLSKLKSSAFIGHGKEITAVYWRTDDHYIIAVKCIDDSLHIWHLKSGHLDRVESGENVEYITNSCQAKLDFELNQNSALTPPQIFSVATYPTMEMISNCKFNSAPIIAVFIINIKVLIDELTNGEAQSEQPTTPPAEVETRGLDDSNINEHPSTTHPNRPSVASSTHSLQQSTGRSNFGKMSLEVLKKTYIKSKDRFIKKPLEELPKSPVPYLPVDRGLKPDKGLVGALVSFIFGWGLDLELDQFCEKELNLRPPRLGSLGCKGAGGYLSFAIPQKEPLRTPVFSWNLSPHIATQRLLTIVAMVRSLIKNYELDHDPSEVMRRFGSTIPSIIVKQGSKLSLPIITRYWQDSVRKIVLS